MVSILDFEVISKKWHSEVSKFLHVIYTIQTLITLSKEGFSETIILLIYKIVYQNNSKSKNYNDTVVYIKRERKPKNYKIKTFYKK